MIACLINSFNITDGLNSLMLNCLLGVFLFAVWQPALAIEKAQQLEIQNSNVSVQIESVDQVQAQQEQLKTLMENSPPAYQDKVMSVSELLELTHEAAEEIPEGFQSYFLETRANYTDSKTNKTDLYKTGDLGLRFEYLYETASLGEVKIQAQTSQQANNKHQDSLSFEEDEPDTSITLINNNLYLTPSIAADSALGDISSELTDALRRSSRVALGVDNLQGARTRIRGEKFDLRLGSGDLGKLQGSPYAGYRQTDGRLSWLGASQQMNKHLVIGFQANQLDRFRTHQNNAKLTSAALALNYKAEDKNDKKLRFTLLKSQKSTAAEHSTTSQGAYLEGGFRVGRYLHEFGAYRTDPELYFGENLLSSDEQGASWSFTRDSSQFSFSAGLSLEEHKLQEKNPDKQAKTLGFDGSLRYRLDRNHSYGGSLRLQQIRYADTDANDQRSVYAYVYYELINADWGRSRFSTTVHRNEKIVSNDIAATGDEVQWEQDWLANSKQILSSQPELITTIGLAHDRSADETRTYPTAGMTGRYWLNSDWSLNSSLRYSASSGKLSSSQGLSGSVSSEYQLSAGLAFGAALNLNQAKVEVERNGMHEAQTSRSHDKSAQVYLRWEGSRGREHSVIGKRTIGLAGTGGVIGSVFFDTNQDGQRQGDEAGVPEVEVYLDGGYSVRTDQHGYYEFTRVATGAHALTLNLDTVPLPWSVKEESFSVEVSLRGQTSANLALTKGAD